MKEERERLNTWANTIECIAIHISEAQSGLHGYYCQGCGREMIAKKGSIIMHHFAHDPKDVENKGKCTYSDESYRHKLAKETLQRIKKIKVPTLYKYPPIGEEGRPLKLRDAEFIHAHSVHIEVPFYEDEHGNISNGHLTGGLSDNQRFLLVQPDVVFFDENNRPILFIEIVATHKPDVHKISKIKSLGINTVQITVPQGSPQEIEDAFFVTNRTKWVYNYEQDQATYIRTSQGGAEDIPPLDEDQRKLLEAGESYECRAFQIRDLIRGINKCLASQPYTEFSNYLREELRRVERNTEANRERLRDIQNGHKKRIEEEFALERKDVEQQERAITEASKLLDEKHTDLESRYYRKRGELEQSQKNYRAECEDEIERITEEFERLGTNAVDFRTRSEEIRREEADLEQRYRDQIERIEGDSRSRTENISELERRKGGLPEQFRQLETELRAEFNRKTESFGRYFEQRKSGIREEFEQNRRESTHAIETRDSKRVSRVQGRLRHIFETREKLLATRERKVAYTRLLKFRELFETGAYKDWI